MTRRGRAGLSIAAVAVLALAVPASAQPLAATACSGNVCMSLAGSAGGTATIQAWARTTNFTGYFTLQAPGNHFVTSPSKTWLGHKGNSWTVAVANAPAGSYCITGNPGQGTVCETLS